MLDTLEAGLQKIQTPDDEVRGMLQIAVPSDLGRNLLLTLFRDFANATRRCACGCSFPTS
jgi:DNA-binding transcriptional LysR family regulator